MYHFNHLDVMPITIDLERFTNPSFIDRWGWFNFKVAKQEKALVDFVEEREYNRVNKRYKVFCVTAYYDYYMKEIKVETIVDEGRAVRSSYAIEDVIKDYKSLPC